MTTMNNEDPAADIALPEPDPLLRGHGGWK